MVIRISDYSHAMATQHGHLKEFQPESDLIKAYLERVRLYFMANAVDDNRQVAVVLSSIGGLTYALLSDLVALHLPSTLEHLPMLCSATWYCISLAHWGTYLCSAQRPGGTASP